MKQTVWRHENGARVTITEGSAKPPMWALNLIGRVVARDARNAAFRRLGLRWTKGRGGGRFYPYGGGGAYRDSIVAVNADGEGDNARYVLLHELAHWADHETRTRYTQEDPKPHGDAFHDHLYRIARDEGMLRLVQRCHTPKAALTRAGARWREANRVCTRMHQEVNERCDGTHEPGTERVGNESWRT